MWRKLGLLGVLLSVLQSVVDLTDRDGTAGTVAEVALLATVFGGKAAPTKPGHDQAAHDQVDPVDLLSSLAQ